MLSSNDIRGKYFGKSKDRGNASPLAAVAESLTPSAKFVIAEAKKRMGEKLALHDGVCPEEDELYRLVRLVEETEGETLSERERNSVVATLTSSLDHYDILTPLIEAGEVNDIIVRSFDDISVQIGRRNVQIDLSFPDELSYRSFVENLLKRAGKACTLATPVIDAAVDPHVRACVTHESFSPPGSGPMLTLRIARHSGVTLEGLVHHELAPREVLEYLAALIQNGAASLLIAGEVGTGKTTLVKALVSRIGADEAILIIEDTHEIVLQRQFTRTLLTREANTEGAGRISPSQAIRTGMRMAMNRIILGEMRDAETAESFVDVCASGHPGMSTIHARSARDALSRLELFLSRAQAGVGVETVRRQIADAISVVVFLDLDREHKKRRLMSVLEVGTSADGAVQLSPMFSFEPDSLGTPLWRRESGVSFFGEQLRYVGLTLPETGAMLSLDPEQEYRAFRA